MKKIQIILVLLLFLTSALGLPVNAHLCQGNIKSISLLLEAEDCGMLAQNVSCETISTQDGLNKTPCCKSVDGLGFNHFLTTQKTAVNLTANHDDGFKVHWIHKTNVSKYTWLSYQSKVYQPPPKLYAVKQTILFEVFLI